MEQEDIKAVSEVLDSRQIAQGPMVDKFEKELSKFISVKGGVATNSGTSALHLALLALDIRKGDEVIIPSYVCTALLNTINYVHAKPVIADINMEDFNISVSAIEKKINYRTKAIIVPHMFGLAADINEILNFGVSVIEDCAQSIGATYRGNMVGSFGVISIFSFYATKMLATGEGGMAVSNSDELLERMMDLREYDFKSNYKVRYNYKMTDMQAALGISQLSKLPTFIDKRKLIARYYSEEFSNLGVILPTSKKHKEHIFYRYVVRTNKDTDIKRYFSEFKKKNVICDSPVYKPLHVYIGLSKNDFINTEEIINSAISIPIYPSLTENEMNYVSSIVKEVLK
jgi:perosamine synthetase